MQDLVIEAPAKINLTLDVLGQRDDGYHELETIMHQITLTDKVYLEKAVEQGISINSNSSLIPLDNQNLAYRAAEAIVKKHHLKKGIKIYIEKNIPVGAGLAGGSTDAAAVLIGIDRLLALDLSSSEILDLAAGIGSDVPFCVWGGTALARGRGEILTPLESSINLQLVLVKPDFSLSTAEVYRSFDLNRVETSPDNSAFLDAWKNCDIISVAKNMVNVLESVSIQKHPEIWEIKHQLIALGALNAAMSGSGPTVFGVFTENRQAQQAYDILKRKYKETHLASSYR